MSVSLAPRQRKVVMAAMTVLDMVVDCIFLNSHHFCKFLKHSSFQDFSLCHHRDVTVVVVTLMNVILDKGLLCSQSVL